MTPLDFTAVEATGQSAVRDFPGLACESNAVPVALEEKFVKRGGLHIGAQDDALWRQSCHPAARPLKSSRRNRPVITASRCHQPA